MNGNNIQELLTTEISKTLQTRNLQVKPHQEYYSNRTIFVGNIRPFITNYSAEELLNNFNNSNRIKAESIFTISTFSVYRNTLKITLTTTEEV